MITFALSNWLLLAQEAADKSTDPNAVPPPQAPGFSSMLPAILGIVALFYLLVLRPQKNKDQQFRSMVDNLKEKDRVVTIGGIHGVVTNVQRETGVVTIRVDEATGTKIRVGTSAIAKIITEDEKTD